MKALFIGGTGTISMPLNFAELGAKEEDIPKLVQALCYGDGRTGSRV